MKITITTDDGVVLETIDGAEHGCSDKQIIEKGKRKDYLTFDLGGIVEDAIDQEILAMIRRGKPS